MTKSTNKIKATEAKVALDSIAYMKNSALKRGTPPHWLGITLAISAGALVILAANNLREYQVLIIIMLGVFISYQKQKTGVALKNGSIKFLCIAIAILLPLYFLLIFGAQFFSNVIGLTLSSLLAGLLLSSAVYLLSILEHHLHKSKGHGSKQ